VGDRTADLTVLNDNLKQTSTTCAPRSGNCGRGEDGGARRPRGRHRARDQHAAGHQRDRRIASGNRGAPRGQAIASDTLKRSDLERYQQTALESSQMILRNLQRADKLVRSFKQVAVDQSSEQRRMVNLREYLDEILTSLHPALKKTQHTVVIDCPRQHRARHVPRRDLPDRGEPRDELPSPTVSKACVQARSRSAAASRATTGSWTIATTGVA
jgi:hypothetical protein